MGHMFLAAGKTTSTNYLPILFIGVLFVVLYMVMIRPQRNRQRQAMQMQRGVVVGQRVRTTAGMYGTITWVDDSDVEVEVAPGVRIKMLRRAVMDVVGDESPTASEPAQPQTDFGDGQSKSTFGDGQSQNNFGESPADDWSTQDRNPQA
jgi:preprotein translocase subunit YajC